MNYCELILNDLKSLPSLPVSLARITALVEDENSSASEIELALRPDPALTANVLKMANSAFFGARGRVTSVRQAITLIGHRKLLEATYTAALSGLLPPMLHGYGIDSACFFRHSIAVAVIGQKMSVEVIGNSVEQSFTCGLLHDIGKLITSDYIAGKSDELQDAIRMDGEVFIDWEEDVLGIEHANIGASMAEKWNLPNIICEAIRFHHSPGESGGIISDIIHVSDCMAHAMGYGADIGELSRRIDPGALERTGLSSRQREMIISDAADNIESLSGLFK